MSEARAAGETPAWFSKTPEGWLIQIHAQPGAKKCEIAGLHGDALKVRIAAAPVDGRANDALIAYLAGQLGVSKSLLRLERGSTGRRKTVRVASQHADPRALLNPSAV